MARIDFAAYREDLIESLQACLRIPSVRDMTTAKEGQPYGKGVAEALNWIENMAKKDGFVVKNYEGHVVTIDSPHTGKEKTVEVVSHLDVVGVGAGWDRDPFSAEIIGNRLYARGTDDMKRAAVLVYYAFKILKDYGIPLKNQLRLVYGGDEETNMDDMKYYRWQVPAPDFAFTPDGTFPLCIGEKGAYTVECSSQVPKESLILSLKGGEGSNVVASSATLILKTSNSKPAEVYCNLHNIDAVIHKVEDKVQIDIKGVGAHASTPELGINAIVQALALVSEAYQDDYASYLFERLGQFNGEGVGIAQGTKEMGKLTFNLGTIHWKESGEIMFEIDIRYPNSTDSRWLAEQLQKSFPDFEFLVTYDVAWTLQDANRPAIQALMQTYKEFYPDLDQELQISGGVTYSKFIPNCVSFGASLPTDQKIAHQANEYICIDSLETLLALYTETLRKLGQLEEL